MKTKWYCIQVLILVVFVSSGYAQTETVVYNEYIKFVDYLYSHDSLLRKKLYIEENGTYKFLDVDEQGERIVLLSDKRKMIRVMAPIVLMVCDSVEVIKNYFPKGMSPRWDSFPNTSLTFSYLLHLFSEQPLNEMPEEDVIRITYAHLSGGWDKETSEKATGYHLIKIVFRQDSAIMLYKEGKFVRGTFSCYEEKRIVLKKRDVKHILKYDRKIKWESEPVTCDGDFSNALGVIERKKNGCVVSLVRNAYCERSTEKESFWSMMHFIAHAMRVRDKYLINKIESQFPF